MVNFGDELTINRAAFINGAETIALKKQYQLVQLKKALLPGQEARLEFDISYEWKAVNGHRSFNAIVQNGSFMRISRYYPQFGYLSANEIQDELKRKQLHLGNITPVKAFDAPMTPNDDFINLDMTISTPSTQTAIGVGECAGVMIDLVATLLLEAAEKIVMAEEFLAGSKWADSVYCAYAAQVLTAKALLLQHGVQCNTQLGILNDFDKHFTANSLYSESSSFKTDVMRMNENEPTETFASDYLEQAKDFISYAEAYRKAVVVG